MQQIWCNTSCNLGGQMPFSGFARSLWRKAPAAEQKTFRRKGRPGRDIDPSAGQVLGKYDCFRMANGPASKHGGCSGHKVRCSAIARSIPSRTQSPKFRPVPPPSERVQVTARPAAPRGGWIRSRPRSFPLPVRARGEQHNQSINRQNQLIDRRSSR